LAEEERPTGLVLVISVERIGLAEAPREEMKLGSNEEPEED
jgi:hypothetical protein